MVRVQLAVYDLSKGMASNMSRQIIGTHVPGIWKINLRKFFSFWYCKFFGWQSSIEKLKYDCTTFMSCMCKWKWKNILHKWEKNHILWKIDA